MSKSLLILTIFATILTASVVQAESCAEIDKPDCADLGYTKSVSDCNDLYFTCPFDRTKVKCDEIAAVGDIKYSKSLTPGEGWLYCDGSAYSKTKYPELYNLIGYKFGGSSSSPKLPDYRGLYLRGAGTTTVRSTSVGTSSLYTRQSSSIIKHKHNYPFYYLHTAPQRDGGNAKQNDFREPTGATVTFGSSGSTETCPASVGLYPYIYAGVVK